jgi:hypothetical protein
MTPTATPEMLEAESILDRAKRLSPAIREKLGFELLYSVSPPPNSDADWTYWKAELVRRSEAVENGAMKSYTLEEAMARIRKAREEREPWPPSAPTPPRWMSHGRASTTTGRKAVRCHLRG